MPQNFAGRCVRVATSAAVAAGVGLLVSVATSAQTPAFRCGTFTIVDGLSNLNTRDPQTAHVNRNNEVTFFVPSGGGGGVWDIFPEASNPACIWSSDPQNIVYSPLEAFDGWGSIESVPPVPSPQMLPGNAQGPWIYMVGFGTSQLPRRTVGQFAAMGIIGSGSVTIGVLPNETGTIRRALVTFFGRRVWFIQGCTKWDSAGGFGFSSTDPLCGTRPSGDWDRDTREDLVWQSPSGQVAIWPSTTTDDPIVLSNVSSGNRVVSTKVAVSDGAACCGFPLLKTLNVAALTFQDDLGRAAVGENPLTAITFHGPTTDRIVGRTAFDTSSDPVVVWQSADGRVFTDSTVIYGGTSVWRVVGFADLNGDTQTDMIWQSPTGSVAVWYMVGGRFASVATIYAGVSDWKIAAVGVLDADGVPSLIWQAPWGAVVAWRMVDRTNPTRFEAVTLFPNSTTWKIVGPR